MVDSHWCRDLKPQNILFDDMREDAIVKIVDFGVSAQIESGKMLKKPTGTVMFGFELS